MNPAESSQVMRPLIMQAPAAPAFLAKEMLSAVMPPMAYTGIDTLSHRSFKKRIPLPGRPFLQSVSNIWPAVM